MSTRCSPTAPWKFWVKNAAATAGCPARRYQSSPVNERYLPNGLETRGNQAASCVGVEVVSLQEEFQVLERRFAHVVKVGRTQLQDAVLTTLGREMSAYAEALNRDRWRIYKCEERLRVINLGGTAIGTGLSAPRDFIFTVTDILRANTSMGFAALKTLSITRKTPMYLWKCRAC